MSPTLVATFAVLSAVSLESRPMKVEAYCVPTETLKLGDPVFLKIVIENTGVQPVRTYSQFSRAFGTLRLEVESPFYDYIYLARADSGGGEAGRIPLPSGTRRVVAYEIVEMPRPLDFKHNFWDFVSTNPDPSFLTATLHDRQGNERWIAQALSLRIQPRPQEEMEALQSVLSEAEHRRQPEFRRLTVRPKDSMICVPLPHALDWGLSRLTMI